MKQATKKIVAKKAKDDFRQELGNTLRKKRESLGMSQEKLASIIGSRQTRIPEIESGKTKSIDTYIACLRALGGEFKIQWQ